jgi:hypothetical protein
MFEAVPVAMQDDMMKFSGRQKVAHKIYLFAVIVNNK